MVSGKAEGSERSFSACCAIGWSTTFVLMSFLHRRAHGARRDSLVFSACSAVSAVEKRSKLASTRLGETTRYCILSLAKGSADAVGEERPGFSYDSE